MIKRSDVGLNMLVRTLVSAQIVISIEAYWLDFIAEV